MTHLREWARSVKASSIRNWRRVWKTNSVGSDWGWGDNLRVGSCFFRPFVSFCASVFFSSDPWPCRVVTNCFSVVPTSKGRPSACISWLFCQRLGLRVVKLSFCSESQREWGGSAKSWAAMRALFGYFTPESIIRWSASNFPSCSSRCHATMHAWHIPVREEFVWAKWD